VPPRPRIPNIAGGLRHTAIGTGRFETMSLEDRDNWPNRLLGQNRIHRVIVDEVAAHDLVSVHPGGIVN
jgi:hypothetical protein